MAPVEWNAAGWPVVNNDGTIDLDMSQVKTLPRVPLSNTPDEDFNNSKLGVEWNWQGVPVWENYSLTERKGFLRIKGSEKQAQGKGNAGLTVYMCPFAHYDLFISDNQLKLRYRLGELCHESTVGKVPDDFVYVRVKGNAELYTFFYSIDGMHYKEAGRMNTRFLSSETNGGFTGIYLGLFAEGDAQAYFDFFNYEPSVSDASR